MNQLNKLKIKLKKIILKINNNNFKQNQLIFYQIKILSVKQNVKDLKNKDIEL